MTTEYFKVRNGLSIGEDTFTVDATTGDTVISGNLTVNGDTTTLNTTELSVEDNKITLNKNVTGTASLDAGIEVERGDDTNSALNWNETTNKWEQNRAGTVTVIPVNTTELDEGSNLYYTTARSNNDFDTRLATKSTTDVSEGTNLYYTTARSNSDFDSRLAVKSTDNLTEGTTNKYFSNALARSALSAGTGITYDSATGAISIGQAVATTSSPTFASLTATGNIVKGAIRNSTSAGQGDIWAVLSGASPTNPFRGISIDNSADTTRGPGTVLRSFSGGASAGSGTRGRLVFEKARGTSASPTAIQTGDILGSIDATGYTSTGWLNDITSVAPAFFGFTATENWVSNTNLGLRFDLFMAPTATTVTSNANTVGVMALSPETSAVKGDRLAFSQGKTAAFTATGCSTSGSTLTIGTLTSGTVAVGQVISTTGAANNQYIIANISGSGSGSTWTLGGSPGTTSGLSVTGQSGFLGGTVTGGVTVDALADLRLIKNNIKNSAGTTVITTNTNNVEFARPVKFPVYTSATKPASGTVGEMIAISDSAGGSNPNGMMAFWDTTNNRWSYIHDNSAA
jgi:hypothetical protein